MKRSQEGRCLAEGNELKEGQPLPPCPAWKLEVAVVDAERTVQRTWQVMGTLRRGTRAQGFLGEPHLSRMKRDRMKHEEGNLARSER